MENAMVTEMRKSEHLHGQQAESVSGQEAAEIKEWVFVVGCLVASETYAGFPVIPYPLVCVVVPYFGPRSSCRLKT